MKRTNLAVADLFTAPKHDPGGKVSTALPKDMVGHAEFYGPNDEYRLWLSRYWGDRYGEPARGLIEHLISLQYVLWIGMNPSTATAEVNDPTITREINFTRSWGYSAYVKCNVMDYRATNQRDLLKTGIKPCSDRNIQTILDYARKADKIILCYGVPHKSLQHFGIIAVDCLRAQGYSNKLFCLGKSLMGNPRHPLYLRSDTQLEPF